MAFHLSFTAFGPASNFSDAWSVFFARLSAKGSQRQGHLKQQGQNQPSSPPKISMATTYRIIATKTAQRIRLGEIGESGISPPMQNAMITALAKSRKVLAVFSFWLLFT